MNKTSTHQARPLINLNPELAYQLNHTSAYKISARKINRNCGSFEHKKLSTKGQVSIVFWEPSAGARNRRLGPAGPALTLAPQHPQAVEHRTGPWTQFKHARSGLGEPGARAQSARDNDLDERRPAGGRISSLSRGPGPSPSHW